MLTKLFTLFKQEEKKRSKENIKSPEMTFVSQKRDNIYDESTGVHFIIKTTNKNNARDLRTLSFN